MPHAPPGPKPPPAPPWHPGRLAARLPFLRRRAEVAASLRTGLAARGYLEVETPCLMPSPGMEVHLAGFPTPWRPLDGGPSRRLWLRTSPELALKRLLAGGAGPVFEFARVWRNGEAGPLHAPEFTLVEWYRPGLTLAGLMDEAEALVRAAHPGPVARGGASADLAAPFERLTVSEAFARHAGLDVLATVRPDGSGDGAALRAAAGLPAPDGSRDEEDGGWEDLFFRLLLERVEPRLGRGRATFLTHWPAPQAALARRDPADPRAALRFELYAVGVELANAFEELTDPAESRVRAARDDARRAVLHPGDPTRDWAADAGFLAALDHGLPPASGIALGLDRLAMLASGAPRVEDVLWLPAGGDGL